MTLLLLLMAMSPAAGQPDAHEKLNPLYQQLRRQGTVIAPKQYLTLPAPVMADGLDAKEQKEVLKKLLAEDVDLSAFLDNSITSPQLLQRPQERKGDPAAPVRSLDLYFVAHGDLGKLADQAMLERLVTNQRRPNKARILTTEELKLRGITIPEGSARQESFGYGQINILVRVQVRALGRSYWSQSLDSIVAATELDERFAGDPEFPNQWRPLIKEDDEEVKEGPPQVYRGAAYYAKMTRLKEPAGAIFVETHIVFTEPIKWFDGENVLRSKLPAATMSLVRNFRRELIRANK